MKTVIAIIIVLALAGGGYALVKNNDNDTTKKTEHSATNETSNSSSNGQDTKPVATTTVTISDFAFSPADIAVKKGDTVTWTNNDAAAHNVAETDGRDGPKSGNLNKGESYSFTFNDVGTFKYNCSIHPQMTGTVTVAE
jgi:plastocyanin